MLFKLNVGYEDGRCETTIIHVEEGEQVKIYPKRDGITFSGNKRFRYKVKKHPYLCKTIVRFGDKTFIYPEVIECHPKTTLDDIVEINEIGEVVDKIVKVEPPKPKIKEWKFESSSGGGTYIVTETKPGVYKCQCPGYFRAKDRKCKHIKEVEKN